MADLALLYEHPAWFVPLFAALDRRGVDYTALKPDGHFDPADHASPAPVVFNRIAMSSFLRDDEHVSVLERHAFGDESGKVVALADLGETRDGEDPHTPVSRIPACAL